MKSLIEQGKLLSLPSWRVMRAVRPSLKPAPPRPWTQQGEKWFSPLGVLRLGFFLALSGAVLSAFFGMNENIVRDAQFLVPRVPDFAKTVHVVRFDAVQDAQHFFIDFRLQLLRKRLVLPGKFRPEYAGFLQFAAGVHDPRKRKGSGDTEAVDLGPLGGIKGHLRLLVHYGARDLSDK